MHRQIAGKLTGRVTKWIVLAVWLVVVRRRRGLRGQAHRRPEQRGVLLAARERGVHARPRPAGRLPGPERHPDRRGLPLHVRAAGPGRRWPPIETQAREFARMPGAHRRREPRDRPTARRPGRLAATARSPRPGHVQLRQERLEQDAGRRRRAARHGGHRRRDHPHRGPGRPGRGLRRGVRRPRQHPALRRPSPS